MLTQLKGVFTLHHPRSASMSLADHTLLKQFLFSNRADLKSFPQFQVRLLHLDYRNIGIQSELPPKDHSQSPLRTYYLLIASILAHLEQLPQPI